MERFNKEMKKNFTGFTPAAAECLRHHPWPGNIRELKNVIERTMILAPEGEIDAGYLFDDIGYSSGLSPGRRVNVQHSTPILE